MYPEIELKVVASLVQHPSQIGTVSSIIKKDCFTSAQLAAVYDVLCDRYNLGKSTDRVSVKEETGKRTKLGREQLDKLFSSLAFTGTTDVNIESAAELLNDAFIGRKLKQVAEQIEAAVDSGEHHGNVISFAESLLSDTSGLTISKNELLNLGETVEKCEYKEASIYDATCGAPGISSPWPDVNEILGAFRPGRMYGFAARPSQGKSAAVTQLAYHAARMGKKVVMFSHEMDRQSIWRRIVANALDLSAWDMESGELTKPEQQKVKDWMSRNSRLPLYISDCTGRTINSFNTEIRRFRNVNGNPDMVIVDYLQLMRAGMKSSSPYVEISAVSNALREASREYNTIIIPVLQLNRASVSSGGIVEPQLSDIRETGTIEQDLDFVLMIHRPEMYGQMPEGKPKGYTQFFIRKYRQGRIGNVETVFNGRFCRFECIRDSGE